MSNSMFKDLRKKMTLQYSLIFGLIIMLIVIATYAFVWWSLLSIEKKELKEEILHEGEEWISSKEAPVNDREMNSGDMLAYFVRSDGTTVILNQLGSTTAGKLLFANKHRWPSLNRETKLLRMQDGQGNYYRYLSGVARIKDGDKEIGILYMFKNLEVYYEAARRTLMCLGALLVLLFTGACLGSYFLAGKSIKPISDAYDRQKQFTADASHEMRTPLAVMKLGVQGIEDDEECKLSSFSSETLTMIEQEVDRLSRLTENLMTLARSDNSGMGNQFVMVDLSDLSIKVANQLQIVASEKDISIHRRIGNSVVVKGDEQELHRLIVILLDNAIKYAEPATDIVFSLNKMKNSVQIKIADEGPGISNEDKEKIFQRFYRVDKARSRSMGGLGLGLALAKAIVAHHHGKIWVEDNKPQGSIFVVELNA